MNFVINRLGVLPYKEALAIQLQTHARVQKSGTAEFLVLQHPPTITLGKNSRPEHLLATMSDISKLGIDLYHTDRGGEVTAHEPGQLVVYPIVNFKTLPISPRQFVCALEQSVIDTLSTFGITASRDLNHPGVWIAKSKICAIGVRIKDHVSMHGLALNVNNSLSTFDLIRPCGIFDRGVAAMNHFINTSINIDSVGDKLIENLSKHLKK